jgi:pyruvate formate lyase activating enzyme
MSSEDRPKVQDPKPGSRLWSSVTRTRSHILVPVAAAFALVAVGLLTSHALAKRVETRHIAMFWGKLEDKSVACRLCPRACVIQDGKRGFCRARENRDGTLYSVVYGRPCSIARDPIEKCPFYHFLPGTNRLAIATAGCNQTCKYCQNWQISQAVTEDLQTFDVSPDSMVALARDMSLPTVCFTYNEPTVFYEYVYDIAQKARAAGLKSVVVSSGYINEEPLRQLCEVVDAIKIDLKGFSEDFYGRVCGGQLAPVLRNLKIIKESGVHLEIVNLVVPTLNDSLDEIRSMCRWIAANLGPDVPLHFTRFVPNYKLMNLPQTPVTTLEKAIAIAREEGLHYVYIGNVFGHEDDNTKCPNCGRLLIKRAGYDILENDISDGKCRFCGQEIPGVWE